MVNIIQAVGRVIRKAEGKQIGTIVIPVFIDESEDVDHVLSQSAFEPVWQVLKALRAHDRRLADELDHLRLALGRRSKSGGRIHLPANIHLDVPRLLLRDFEQAFYVRTVEQTTDKPLLTIEQILTWADAHKTATGDWPNQYSGQVTDTDDTWHAIQHALLAGRRGLPGGSTLAKLLAEHRGVRHHLDLPDLTIKQILAWADAHKAATGDWPRKNSFQVTGTDETWYRVNSALQQGQRGLPGGSSLAKLLAEYRNVRNPKNPPPLTVEQILAWADAHKAATDDWPNQKSGRVAGTEETWAGVNYALVAGRRGFPGRSSLAKLLAEHRSIRNIHDLSPLKIPQILTWADTHKAATGDWPNMKSGRVTGTVETWLGIDDALRKGRRGLPSGSSLAKLLAKRRNVRNHYDLSILTINQILAWVDAHKADTGDWPNRESGQVTGTNDTWASVNSALQQGFRGLPGGSSLAKLLATHCGVRNKQGLPSLTIEQILAWADAHKALTGRWPNLRSERPNGMDETWAGINAALSRGNRGLPGGSSLPKLLAEHRNVRNIVDLPPLTIKQILQWADTHKKATGHWPSQYSGQVTGTDETWSGVNHAIRIGSRGLPGGSSLAKLLAEHRSVRSHLDLPTLTIKQILAWADAHKAATGHWPNQNSGQVTGTDETWGAINGSLYAGVRGLTGGSSLAKLLAEHRGVRNIRDLPDLTVPQILAWADAHKTATGDWPNKNSGQVTGTDETWAAIDSSLGAGRRSLPGGSSLAKLLAEHRSVRNIPDLPSLTIEQILAWADEHKTTTGVWPGKESGAVTGADETWAGINAALSRGSRGLPGGSSLAKLLKQQRDLRCLTS